MVYLSLNLQEPIKTSTRYQNRRSFFHIKRPVPIYARLFTLAVLLIGIPLPADSMSVRPPMNPEQLEDGDYLQKSNIDSRKILIKDKNNHFLTKTQHLVTLNWEKKGCVTHLDQYICRAQKLTKNPLLK